MEREMIEGIYQAWQTWLMWACLGMLGVMAVGIILYGFGLAWGKVREWWSLPLIERVVAAVFVLGFVYYGSTKSGSPSVRWDDGLADNGTLITNDTVSVRWTYSGIPSASSVFIDYREAGSTNEWLNLAETLASAQEWTGTLANATNYDYWVYSTYVPPVPVHTNGVWVGQAYETKARVGAKSFLILNGMVQEHGRTIAPPAAKRRDLPYDSEVEFLESHGTEFVKTGFTMTDTTSYRGRIMPTGLQFNSGMCGYRFVNSATAYGNMRFSFIYNDGRIGLRNGLDVQNSTKKVVVGSLYNIEIDNQYVRLNDSVWINADNKKVAMTPPGEVWLFFVNCTGYYNIDVQHPVCMRLYSWQILDNGIIVRDFIPVRVGTTGALYDKRGVGGMNGDGTARNDGLYFNCGTGNFGYGNDK